MPRVLSLPGPAPRARRGRPWGLALAPARFFRPGGGVRRAAGQALSRANSGVSFALDRRSLPCRYTRRLPGRAGVGSEAAGKPPSREVGGWVFRSRVKASLREVGGWVFRGGARAPPQRHARRCGRAREDGARAGRAGLLRMPEGGAARSTAEAAVGRSASTAPYRSRSASPWGAPWGPVVMPLPQRRGVRHVRWVAATSSTRRHKHVGMLATLCVR